MTDYTKLDAAILKELASGPAPNFLLCERLRHISEPLAKPNRYGQVEGWRVVDRRLQALRKAGRIIPGRKVGWTLA